MSDGMQVRGDPPEVGEKDVDWQRLLSEFEDYEPDEDMRGHDCADFERALLESASGFVEPFLARKAGGNFTRGEAVRALYAFLLEKRYEERLNLLHFAFSIFDDHTCLPDEVINRTPFPHEEGSPPFRYFTDPDFEIKP